MNFRVFLLVERNLQPSHTHKRVVDTKEAPRTSKTLLSCFFKKYHCLVEITKISRDFLEILVVIMSLGTCSSHICYFMFAVSKTI
jgi:hypothetical protein